MNILIPTAKQHFRLVDDWLVKIDVSLYQRNLVDAFLGSAPLYGNAAWAAHIDRVSKFIDNRDTIVIPKGTVIKVQRLQLKRNLARGEQHTVPVSIFVSPNPNLSPLGRGGNHRGMVTFNAALDDFNGREVEEVTV